MVELCPRVLKHALLSTDHPEHGLATSSCHAMGFSRRADLPLPKITLFQTKTHCQC